jgi:hypothetical protein
MKYLLTEEEYKALIEFKGKCAFYKHRLEVAEERINSTSPILNDDTDDDMSATEYQDIIERKNIKIVELENDVALQLKRASIFQERAHNATCRTINLGTYPVEIAKMIQGVIRGGRGNKNLRTARVKYVRLKGRGPRIVDGVRIGNQSDIHLSRATGAAVYIDLKTENE